MSEMNIKILDSPIAFHRCLLQPAGGNVLGALLLSQAIYWQNRCESPDGWWSKTMPEWFDRTGMNRRELDSAKRSCKGILLVERRGVPARCHYKVNIDALQSRLADSAKLDCSDQPNKAGGNGQSTYKEDTRVNTLKGKSSSQRFIGLWCGEFFSKFGQRYAAVTPRDAQATKRFFEGNEHVVVDDVVSVAKRAWEHGNPNTHWNCSRSRSIAAFLNSYNEVIAEIGLNARTDAEKYGAPGPRDFEGRPL